MHLEDLLSYLFEYYAMAMRTFVAGYFLNCLLYLRDIRANQPNVELLNVVTFKPPWSYTERFVSHSLFQNGIQVEKV